MILKHIIESNSWIWFLGAEIPLKTCLTRKPPYSGFITYWKDGTITHCNICFLPILILRIFIRPFVSVYQTFKWYLITKPQCRKEWQRLNILRFIDFMYFR